MSYVYGDMIRHKIAKRPIWHVYKELPNGDLRVWSNGRGFRTISQVELFEKLPARLDLDEDEPTGPLALPAGAGGLP